MVIEVKVKTSCRSSKVSFEKSIYQVCLKSKPYKNKANIELIDLLSDYFNTSKSSVKILKGLKGKQKLVEILEYEA